MSRLLPFVIVCAVVTASAVQQSHPWPPGLQKVPAESPVLSPEDSMKTFFIAPGYRVELVAQEPMIQEPVFIDWDAAGRLWVVEMPGYMEDLPASTERDPTGRVSVLEDTDADGRMDKKTVFLDKLVLPRTIKILHDGVLVAEPPHVWLARDTNGDLRADTKESVTDQYGQALANVEHNANSLLWGMDNWMHTSEVDMFMRLKNGTFEVRKTLPRGQWGASQDDAGRVYRNTNQSALFADIVPTPYYVRNPNLLRTRGSYEPLGSEELNTTWPVRPTPAVNRGYQDGVLRPDGTLASYTSVCAPTVFRGDRLPGEVYGNVFVAEPAANLVSRIVVSEDGKMLRGRKAYEGAEFLAATDERFRPVYLSSAPDGTLYVVDMYHGIIQHKGYITEYLRDQILERRLERPQGHGRIYRIVHETTRRGEAPSLATATAAQLVEALAHPNGWWRDTAQQLIVQRGERSVAPQLTKLASGAPDWRTRLHALWTLDGLEAIEPQAVARALGDASPEVRTSAVRLSERWLDEAGHPLRAAVLKRMDDEDWSVRRQLAASLGAMSPAGEAEIEAVASMLERYGEDPITVDAAVSGVAGRERDVLARVLRGDADTPARRGAIATLAATIVRGGQDAPIQAVLAWTAEASRPAWQGDALLQGLEAALLNEPLPGSPRRGGGSGRATAAASTARGARGGPGGAPAFPRPEPATPNPPSLARGRGATAGVRLASPPAPLLARAAEGGERGRRVEALLARFVWPGKAGASQAAAPLSPEEQKRLAEGQTVYKTLCIACHQEDGRGREKVAPTLVGSPFVLGDPSVPVRILLHGKEGQMGLMPPLGAVLTDEQIAGVLTYVRRSFGNEAETVHPATAAGVRGATADRSRPWTEAELGKQ